ncbi:hypothetical protein [Neoroseomonas lacus]|uniref:hypothetical protein n=1 Tax=Neoroseomonas lacus TaxID=287609 RepID=UPI0016676CC4|nr:hypothetical protein [Neoroseomonas lacus]
MPVAEDMRADASTLRLIGIAQQTVYFTDRPARTAGHLPMAAHLEEWTTAAGRDNFTIDPPNAMLSVFEPGQPHPKTLDTISAMVEPMDMVEIRAAREPHLYAGKPLPLIMRGWVSTITRDESIAQDGTPQRLSRGDLVSAAYMTRIAHQIAPLQGWTTSVALERGTGFLDRTKRQQTPYFGESGRGPFS